ncbi:hypothetical protein [Hoeflea sp. AS16]|uniref:hypothetical protein n=1 Tax=Hoeflea sp. AS16 TaxID=3135779 RepID=UPI00316B7BC6
MVETSGQDGNLPAHLVCAIDRLSPGARERLLRQARAFIGRHPHARVVSFVDEFDGVGMDADRQIENWRSALGAEAYNRAWRLSYDQADEFVARLSGELQSLLQPYYHSIADRSHQFLQLDALLADPSRPTMVIFPARSTKPFSGMPAKVSRVSSLSERARVAWRRVQFVAGAATSRLRRRRQPSTPASSAVDAGTMADTIETGTPEKDHILIAVQEGVAAINSPSAFAVVDQLRTLGRGAVILTPNRTIQALAASKGIAVLCPVELSPTLLRLRWMAFAWTCFAQLRALASADAVPRQTVRIAHSLQGDLPLWLLLHATASAMLEHYHQDIAPIGAGLLINEGTPISGLALSWLRQKGIPDCGYWPALLGDRPDCDYFPASSHLVYGDQLRDHMLALGFDPDTVSSVGSVNYDGSLGRNKPEDVALVKADIVPEWDGQSPLVVVATEALQRPEEELRPVLETLASIDNVTIVLKLHPADSADYFRNLLARLGLADRVRLVERCDLDALLHAADLLICVLSNIIVNAALLGTPTLVCDFSNKRAPLDFVSHGLALGCFSADQLPQIIPSMLDENGLRKQALELLPRGMKGFNKPSDGRSALRIARLLHALADRGRKGSF